MKAGAGIISLWLICACESPERLVGYGSAMHVAAMGSTLYEFNDSTGFTGRDTVWTTFTHNDTTVRVDGRVAIDASGQARLLRTGSWLEYYGNGQVRCEGEYGIGRFTQCCAHGPCAQFYNFKKGRWRWYYPNGQVLAEGDMHPARLHLRTSCRHGDHLLFSKVERTSWMFWSDHGQPVQPSDSLISVLEKVSYQGPAKNGYVWTLGLSGQNELRLGGPN